MLEFLPLDESLQLWFQVLMLGIIEHQTFISFLKRYNCMVFACSKAINLIWMIGQDDTFWQYGKVSQRKVFLCKCKVNFFTTLPFPSPRSRCLYGLSLYTDEDNFSYSFSFSGISLSLSLSVPFS